MVPEGWDVEGVHYGPKDGIRSSYSRRDMIKEIVEKADLNGSDHLLSHGCFTSNQLQQLLNYLTGEDNQRIEDDSLSQQVAEQVGIPHQKHQDTYNCFSENHLWEILQAVKNKGENQ